jgi:organizing structure protein 2
MSRLLVMENNFTGTVASLAPPKESGEKLLPGVLYVLVSSMAGSIVARNRNILIRGVVPIAIGVGAGWVVLPITMRNVGDLIWRWEEKVPAISETHLRVRDSAEHAWYMTRTHWDIGVNKVSELVSDGREKMQGWVKKGK